MASKTSANKEVVVLVQDLSLQSIFPLLSLCRKFRGLNVQYIKATPAARTLCQFLHNWGFIQKGPEPILNLHLIDTEYQKVWEIHLLVHRYCTELSWVISDTTDRFLKRKTQFFMSTVTASVQKFWSVCLVDLEALRNLARYLKEEKGCSEVFVLSRYARLHNRLSGNPIDLTILSQNSFWRNLIQASRLTFMTCVRHLPIRASDDLAEKKYRLGVEACMGLEHGKWDDITFWTEDGIPFSEIVYYFDRPDCILDKTVEQKAQKLGLRVYSLDQKPPIKIRNLGYLSTFYIRMLVSLPFTDWVTRSILFQINTQLVISSKIQSFIHTFSLPSICHYQEAGPDHISLAADAANSARIGYHWSCFSGPSFDTLRTHHVFFLWGQHDAQICVDSGSTSPHMILCGCPMAEFRGHPDHLEEVTRSVHALRRQGANLILTLFDNSPPTPSFHRFFLEWLLEEPNLGIMIKSKYKDKDWYRDIGADLEGQKIANDAISTGRIVTLNPEISPIDAALKSDLAIGTVSYSAIVVSALQGARVLYLDYGQLGKGPLKPYATLHSLGENRCVFHSTSDLKDAIQQYMHYPEENKHLGDISPILSEFDPFRDGKAISRMREYTLWYLENREKDLRRDEALARATQCYAEKWGADKVIRGL